MKKITIIINILILITIVFIVSEKVITKEKRIKINTKIASYLNESSSANYLKKKSSKKNSYKAVIEIKKMNLNEGLYDKNNFNNRIDKNITLIYPNDYSDIAKHTLILAAHSGNSKVSYFNKLDLLKDNDEVYIYSNGIMYVYKVFKTYKTNKTGSLEYVDKKEALLYLTTCDPKEKDKQLIVVCRLVRQEKY